MTEKTKKIVLSELYATRGDDLERAEMSFGGMSDDDLDSEWGGSGRTPP